MIYILSGVAKSGKTFIVKELIKRFQISAFSTDYLMMSLSLSGKETGVDNTEDDEIVSKQLEPFLFPMIRAMVENGIDYIIEGVHFNPDFMSRLLQMFPHKIKALYLGYAEIDANNKVEELKLHKQYMENPWFQDLSEKELFELVLYLKKVSKNISQQSKLLDIPYVEVYNIKEQTNVIIDTLINS